MRPFIIIREYKKADDFFCQEVIKNYVMSHAKNAFYSCLFREVIFFFNKLFYLYVNMINIILLHFR